MKNYTKYLLSFILFVTLLVVAHAETIENIIKDEQKFGDWTIDCKEDVMIENKECKLFTKFFGNKATIFVQPDNKIANQTVMILPDALENSIVRIKIDKNNIINSDPVDKKNKYGIIPFSPKKQKEIFTQMKNGASILIRFDIRDIKVKGGIREITEKISLNDFGKMLIYYDTKK